ncbi:hypothetical protein O181_071587 [Austropuccinia psidii MF-1]|uniref:Uncharacterized protein n=1 Tax=Austropuccinia psidii MF-1 TaxID=1389203 RepID=A0A9Q3F7Y8_9BASI|nr:hypothetical protein [Austropuccinia psidii MF-1]
MQTDKNISISTSAITALPKLILPGRTLPISTSTKLLARVITMLADCSDVTEFFSTFNKLHNIPPGCHCALNELTIETQQIGIHSLFLEPSPEPPIEEPYANSLPLPIQGKSLVCCIRGLCSHIHSSPKKWDIFKKIHEQTNNPKLMPLRIPTTRWNYFLHQIKQAQQLKTSITLYTQSPKSKTQPLTDEQWAAMEYIKPLLQLLEDACGEFQSEHPTKNSVLPFYHSIRMECQCWASKTNPNWASTFNAPTIKNHQIN